MKKTVAFGLLFILILASCSILIEKRRYNKGLHVEIGRNRLNTDRKNSTEEIRDGKDLSSFDTKTTRELDKSEGSTNQHQISVPGEARNIGSIAKIESVSTDQKTDKPSSKTISREKTSKSAPSLSTDTQKEIAYSNSINKRENGDAYIYGLGVMMTLLGFGALRLNRNVSLKYTRLASSNPYLSKGLITLGYSSLGVLGYLTGSELYHMGTDISDTTQYVLGSTMVIAGGALYAYEKRSSITVWNSFYKRKLGHLIIGASMFGCLVSLGNGIQEGRPQYSPVGYAISYADNSSEKEDNSSVDISTSAASDSVAEEEGGGGAMMALYIFLAIVVLIMTVILTCMLACSDMAFLAVFVGILGLALAVYLCVLAGRSRSSGV